MPLYLMLTNLTDEGRRTVKANPERIKEVNKEVEAMGAKVLAQYAVLGPYDFVTVLDAPDTQTIARVAMQLGARGTLQTMSLAAMSLDEFVKAMKK